MSCDLKPSRASGPHYAGDVFDIIGDGWDLMIAHPPCTFLSGSGAQWYYHPGDRLLPTEERRPHPKYPNRAADREEAVEFFMALMEAPVPRIAVENPVGIMSTRFRKPDQIIQPFQFGDEARKTTCLWLKGLPLLTPTDIVGEGEFVTFASGKKHPKWYADALKLPKHLRQEAQSVTFPGIARAMADQWGGLDG